MDGVPSSLVRELHEVFGLAAADQPTTPPDDLAEVRERLLEEEVRELAAAVRGGRLDEVARELADVVYVVYGTAVTYGIDLDAVLWEVHRANMSKLGPDGRPVLRNGKVQKGDGFSPPDVAGVLARQRSEDDPDAGRDGSHSACPSGDLVGELFVLPCTSHSEVASPGGSSGIVP